MKQFSAGWRFQSKHILSLLQHTSVSKSWTQPANFVHNSDHVILQLSFQVKSRKCCPLFWRDLLFDTPRRQWMSTAIMLSFGRVPWKQNARLSWVIEDEKGNAYLRWLIPWSLQIPREVWLNSRLFNCAAEVHHWRQMLSTSFLLKLASQ